MSSSRSIRLEIFRLSLFSALGLVPFSACGGATSDNTGGTSGASGAEAGAGNGGAPTSGGRSSGGARASGGAPATGGASTGGRSATGGRLGAGGSAAGAGGSAAGTGGSAAGTGGSAGGPVTGKNPFPCLAPKPDPNDPTGTLVLCSDGRKHRPAAEECPSILPRPEELPPSPQPEFDTCTKDADCTQRAHGYCQRSDGQAGALNTCYYGCQSDADCSDGALCECASPVGECISASCRVDAECMPGLLCVSYFSEPGCYFPAYACQQPTDSCATDSDCAGDLSCTVARMGGSRTCSAETCVIGRPFLVEGALRLATPVGRQDWLAHDGEASGMVQLPAAARERLGELWSRAACLEHASVAAFARFTLELLAFGAPAELVALAGQAQLDETRHAQLTFALASRYAGKALGPGPLAVDGALASLDLEQAALSALVEGALGETVAALEAAEALNHATDAAVRAALREIAPDEERHSQLAWRFLKWALAQSEDRRGLAARLEAALSEEEERAGAAAPELGPFAAELRQHGVLSGAESAALRRQALVDVVRPCLEALLFDAARPEGSAGTASTTENSASA